MNKPFTFKKFTVLQDRCAMKIGTDGVLLGAWTSLQNQPNTILDIGAGTGLIALMLAQRSFAETIDALEIDAAAYEQCVSNFEASPWCDRLFCYHSGFEGFVSEITDKFDLIVSNPPFYSEDVSSGDIPRDRARQTQSLPFEKLVSGVSKLLSETGVFSVIIPFKEEEGFVALASRFGLFPKRISRVKGNPSSEIKRSLLEFGCIKTECCTNGLIIETERHRFTEAYKALTRDFYLKI